MKRVLEFLRLTDVHDGKLSLTNVALWVVLAKIATAGEVTLVDAGALFVTLLSYQSKKVINHGQQEQFKTVKAESSAALANAVDALELAGDLIKRVDNLDSKVSQQQLSLGIKDLRK